MQRHPVKITRFGRKIEFRVGLNLRNYYFGDGVRAVLEHIACTDETRRRPLVADGWWVLIRC